MAEYIPALKKIFKPRLMAALLNQAQKVLGPDMALAILDESGGVLHATTAPPPKTLYAFPLMINDQPAGRLSIWPQARILAAAEARFASDFGQTLALLIQEIISREYARRCITDETLDQYREVALLQRMALSLNQSLKMQDVTRALLAECTIAAEMGLIFYRQPETGAFTVLDSFGPVETFRMDRIIQSRLFQEIAAGNKGEIINELTADSRWQKEVDGLFSLLCIPLHASGEWSGALVLAATLKTAVFTAADLKRIAAIASIAATALANAHHFETVQRMLEAMIQSMATAIDSRDPCTSGHSRRVAAFTRRFAEMISMDTAAFPDIAFSPRQIEEIYYAAQLHDVGKIGVREAVLTKAERLQQGRLEIVQLKMALWGALTGLPWKSDFSRIQAINAANVIDDDDIALVERLSQTPVRIGSTAQSLLTPDERERLLIPRGNLMPEEWREIHRHPVESFRILEAIPFPPHLKNVLTIVRQHHEKLNGNGYPDGLRDDAILIPSRMITIVDVYDALTAKDRPYKKAIPREHALSIIEAESRSGQLDPALVAFFRRNVEMITREED